MEYVNGGELFFHLSRMKKMPEHMARFYTAEITLALECLYEKGIVYRDLKPENLFLDKHFDLKIADFGFSGHVVDRHGRGILLTEKVGTHNYMAPELINNQPYSGQGVDLFASAIIVFIKIGRAHV